MAVAVRSKRRKGLKVHRNYTVEEVARLLGVAKATVRRWISNGLPALRDRKPILVLGADLADFLHSRRKARQHCQPTQCFCLKCRAPRNPAERTVEFVPLTPTNGNMRANCSICGTIMHKRIRHDVFENLGMTLKARSPQGEESIGGSLDRSVNVNFGDEGR